MEFALYPWTALTQWARKSLRFSSYFVCSVVILFSLGRGREREAGAKKTERRALSDNPAGNSMEQGNLPGLDMGEGEEYQTQGKATEGASSAPLILEVLATRTGLFFAENDLDYLKHFRAISECRLPQRGEVERSHKIQEQPQ